MISYETSADAMNKSTIHSCMRPGVTVVEHGRAVRGW